MNLELEFTLPIEVEEPGFLRPLIEPLGSPDPQVKNLYVVRCPRGQHRVGIIEFLGHLTYRNHGRHGATGRIDVCSASLQTVHGLRPPTRPDIVCACRNGDHP